MESVNCVGFDGGERLGGLKRDFRWCDFKGETGSFTFSGEI